MNEGYKSSIFLFLSLLLFSPFLDFLNSSFLRKYRLIKEEKESELSGRNNG
jgi:hypothetical protein